MEILWTLIKLYTPLILFIILLFLLFYIKKTHKSSDEFMFNILGFVQFPISISSLIIKRILILITALICLLYYLFIDFSDFFPQRLEMQVYYSPSRIKQSLSIFDVDELQAKNIIYHDFEKYQNEYFATLDKKLQGIISDTSILSFFRKNKSDFHSEGETTMIIEKTSGIHNYYITESKGRLTHILAEAGLDEFAFSSLFEIDKSEFLFIKPTLKDILIDHEITIMPSFKESIVEVYSSNSTKFDHRLYGLTKIFTFPYPRYSNTIYLYENPNVGLIPIAYAVYKEN